MGDISTINRKSLSWKGRLPAFIALREGGPGRPVTLLLVMLAGLSLVYAGAMRTGQYGDSGPAMLFMGVFVLLSLTFWVLVKAGLRSPDVCFVIDRKGVRIEPSPQQKWLDKRMKMLALVVFWLTFKGGQWAAWSPFTRWKDVKKICIDRQRLQVLVMGGPWHIRLVCSPDNFEEVCGVLQAWNSPANVVWQ